MTIENIGLFQAIGGKMNFLNQRQRVISQNIANADTPNYQPKDLKEADFSGVLKGVIGNGQSSVNIETTRQGHLGGGAQVNMADARDQRRTYEIAPAGNAVIMEEQLLNSGRTVADYTLMTNLIRKNVGMIQTALGRQ